MTSDTTPTPDRLTAAELEAWSGFLSTHAAIARELDARLQAGHGMSFRVYDVLATLDMTRARRLRMSDLAARVVLSPSRLTRLVGALEADGHVTREVDPADGRVLWAQLTPRGLAHLRAARRTHHEVVRRRFLRPLSDEDLEHLARCWRTLGTTDPGLDEALGRA